MSVMKKTNYFQTDLDLEMIIKAIMVHSLALYGFYLSITGQILLKTILLHLVFFYLSVIGMSCGVHRYWSHRSFKTVRPIEMVLMVLQTYTGLYSIYEWSLDHRVHHKFVDSDADPYNIKRGFFFAQFGWICMKKTENFDLKAKAIDMSDLTEDKLVMFQHNYYNGIRLLLWSSATLIPYLYWNETLFNSTLTLIMCYIIEAHQVMTINSISHTFGWKPYDTAIEPTFNRFVSYLTLGEGYHNFHHTFPKDYSQCELKWTRNFNISTILIDLCEHMGWVSDKYVMDEKQVAIRRQRTGDTSVRIASVGFLFDYFIGLIVFTWSLWLILACRLYFASNDLAVQ